MTMSLIKFIIKVIENKVAPTAKMDCPLIEPAGASPKLTWTMNAVMVWMLSNGLKVMRGVAPAAMVTAIVSPTAREIAKMNAAIMPLSAAGTITWTTASNRVAPREKAASRSDMGTARMASSLIDATVGIIMIPKTIDALSALKKLTCIPNQVSNTVLIRGVIKLMAK